MIFDVVQSDGQIPVSHMLQHISNSILITIFPSALINSVCILSIPADFPICKALIAASTSLSNVGKLYWYDVSLTLTTDISPSVLCVYSSEQYYIQRSRTSVMHLPYLSCTLIIIFPSF